MAHAQCNDGDTGIHPARHDMARAPVGKDVEDNALLVRDAIESLVEGQLHATGAHHKKHAEAHRQTSVTAISMSRASEQNSASGGGGERQHSESAVPAAASTPEERRRAPRTVTASKFERSHRPAPTRTPPSTVHKHPRPSVHRRLGS